ncbi:coiled-coil domain-containing protein 102A-like [Daphnia pulex]|uniref:coiled-coil domain-containing protein 102A-like n=1 Tax=Daphnia pulex TaxID=6669 RepID=UPI001EE0477F|nr:coiled-coil domain-containing protein 102A-like [Daphnia pulex]
MSQPPIPSSNGPPGQPLPRRPAPSPMAGHHVNHSHGHIHSSQIHRSSGSNHVHGHIHAELESASHLSSSRFDIDWEAKERELEEARARAAQMEKTMRWWSDCTANWREKWSKVRTERNRSREEAKVLRTKLEMALKDSSAVRREKQSIEHENEFLRSELERMAQQQQEEDSQSERKSCHSFIPHHHQQDTSRLGTPELSREATSTPIDNNDPIPVLLSPRNRSTPSSFMSNGFDAEIVPSHFSGAVPKQILRNPVDSLETDDVEYLQQKLTHLKLRLDEAAKTIQAEREEKGSLHKAMESMQLELLDLRGRLEELKCTKQEAERQLISSQEIHRQQVISLQQDRRDEASTRETLDRRLAELRGELERLQTENAAEWGRRERVETERQALERENKKLRTAISDLQERLEKKCFNSSSSSGGGGHSGSGPDSEMTKIHEELEERNKELLELRHAHNKLKKALQDRSVELGHGLRRAEHSEAEVRRLRSRIEELKREVAAAQDELDAATNNVRKLQRTNEELQEQVDSLQIQATHLQTRLRSSNNGSSFLLHRECELLQDTLSEDENNEF